MFGRGVCAFAFAAVVCLTFPARPTAQTGPIAAYSFDEGAGLVAADSSGNSHSGTLSGATWSTAGKYGGALSFDGVNDMLNVADAALLDLTTGMTVEAWVRP